MIKIGYEHKIVNRSIKNRQGYEYGHIKIVKTIISN